MAVGKVESNTIAAVVEEVTEGTLVPPAAAANYFQPEQDGIEMAPSNERVARGVLTAGLTISKDRLGVLGGQGSWPVEMRGSGTEGTAPQYGVLLKSLLGATRSVAANVTTGTGHSGSVLNLGDSDKDVFNIGDAVVVKESNAHHFCFVTACVRTPGAATITVSPAKSSGSFTNGVVLSKSTTYYPADSGHVSFSSILYRANEVRQYVAGCRTKSVSLEGFKTGGIAKWIFPYEGMSYNESVAAAPHSEAAVKAALDSALPPIILSCKIYKDGTEIQMDEAAFSIDQPVSWLMATGHATGRAAGAAVEKRQVKCTLNPYFNGADVTFFTNFSQETVFTVILTAVYPSLSAAGTYVMGSNIGIFMPNCTITNLNTAKKDGVLINPLEIMAHGGVRGDTPEVYISFV